ncbi:unnamed protein product [Trichogramma brassicae]|uniref:Uncharacterized protein n=1 Tax=Trichogramma brassicae TaxID=86971 RepID=A0A6H5J260_9HYME|nr:unnamed protein product [Trichogramma brassicae]
MHLVSVGAGTLRRLRENFNLEIEKERLEFLRRLHPIIDRMVDYPDIRGIFSTDEIESLLLDFINHWGERDFDHKHYEFVELLVKGGYKDEPPSSSLLRTTPLHRAARRNIDGPIHCLFRIYRNFEANYVDEFGLTHFHIACQYSCHGVVKRFLELGRVDVNCPVPETGDSPLHLALACQYGCKKMATLLLNNGANPNLADAKGSTFLHIISPHYSTSFLEMVFRTRDGEDRAVQVNARNESGNTPLHLAVASGNAATAKWLLKRGADPNMADAEGSTALHLICERNDVVSAKMLFKMNDELNQSVWVDALNNSGRTPLQLAVSYFNPSLVDVLLDRGADLSSFVFPTKSYFCKQFHLNNFYKLKLAIDAPAVANSLEKRGYELDKGDALMIMKLFAKHELFEKSGQLEKSYLDDEEFASKAKELMINPSLSLYELIQLPAEEVAKIFTYADYLKIDKSQIWRGFSEGIRNACNVHLCEMASRGPSIT